MKHYIVLKKTKALKNLYLFIRNIKARRQEVRETRRSKQNEGLVSHEKGLGSPPQGGDPHQNLSREVAHSDIF